VTTLSVVTSVSTVGSKKVPPSADRLPPVTTLAPFFTASAMCASTFSTAIMSNEGPDHGARVAAVGDLHRAGSLGKALGERRPAQGIRLAHTQVCPALRYFDAIAPLTAVSICVSSNARNRKS